MTDTPWENDYWTPEPIWRGETVFVLASGPSLTDEVLQKVKGRKTIVVNSSVVAAPWADVWFFTDNGVVDRHREMIESWTGMVVTLSRKAKREMPEKVRRVRGEVMDRFPPEGAPVVRQGRSSGQTAISVAVAFRPKRIGLLGFDMCLVDGLEHHHKEYEGTPRYLGIYENEFIPAFKDWNAAALDVGVEILNCTRGSELRVFRSADLDEVLS